MKVIKPSSEIITKIDGKAMLQKIELAGRLCYKTEGAQDLNDFEKTKAFIKKYMIDKGHQSVLEHESVTIRIICDRGVTHEIVRHRLASYSQESTRYCNYAADKFDNEITVIEPMFWPDCDDELVLKKRALWREACKVAEKVYMELIAAGASAQEARSVLPNSLKTEIVMTMNLREWRHFFNLRTASVAHPQMREITLPLLTKFKEQIPVVFDDIVVK